MWLDVIADCRRLDDAAFEAERAGDVHLAGAFGFEPSEPEYHLPNIVGCPQTPRVRPTIRRPVAGAGAQPHQSNHRTLAAPDYESGGQEFESLRARH